MKERVKQLNGELRISRAEPGTLVHATIPTLTWCSPFTSEVCPIQARLEWGLFPAPEFPL